MLGGLFVALTFDWDLCFLPETGYASESLREAKQKTTARMQPTSPKRSSRSEPTSCRREQGRGF